MWESLYYQMQNQQKKMTSKWYVNHDVNGCATRGGLCKDATTQESMWLKFHFILGPKQLCKKLTHPKSDIPIDNGSPSNGLVRKLTGWFINITMIDTWWFDLVCCEVFCVEVLWKTGS